jgi:hypothetical protein
MASELILRWPEAEPKPEALFRQIGVTQVVAAPPPGAITEALWPGVTRGPNVSDRGDETASASKEPWVDANGFLVQFERALGHKSVLVAPSPPDEADKITPFETVELGLIEARVNGGNFVLTPDTRYRDGLRSGDAKALAAWNSLGVTARWLNEHAVLFGHPPVPTITVLVEKGEATAEIVNLLSRRGGTPRMVSAATPPKPSPDILVLVAASLDKVPPAVYDHARAGATVVIDSKPDPSWPVLKKNEDRTFYSLGKGQVVAYHEAIGDPSEFGLDLIDLVTHRRRPARMWNALASIPLATLSPNPRALLLNAINYGSPVDAEVPARVLGSYTSARLLRPGHTAAPIKVAKRGLMTEVALPRLDHLAVIEFLR